MQQQHSYDETPNPPPPDGPTVGDLMLWTMAQSPRVQRAPVAYEGPIPSTPATTNAVNSFPPKP